MSYLDSHDIDRLREHLLTLLPRTATISRNEIDALCGLAHVGHAVSLPKKARNIDHARMAEMRRARGDETPYTETCTRCGHVQYFQAEPFDADRGGAQ